MKLQEESFAHVASLESMATKLLSGSADVSLTELFTTATNEQANKIVSAWRDLLPKLITKYHDGYQAEGLESKDIEMKRLFYPAWWLKAVGYFDSKINTGPGVIMFSPGPNGSTGGYHWMTLLFTAIISSAFSLIIGYIVLKRYSNKEVTAAGSFSMNPIAVGRRMDYVAIDI